MTRRKFATAAVLALFHPVRAAAQAPGRVYRLGLLAPSAPPPPGDRKTAIAMVRTALADMGYVAGKTLLVDARYADGRLERLPALARALADAKCDAIVAIGSAAIRAARAPATTVPVVFLGNCDPVALDITPSLSRPGGHVTGVLIAPEGTLAAKKLELLIEATSRPARVAMLAPADPGVRLQVDEARRAAAALDVKLAVVELKGADYAGAFTAIAAERPGALFVAAHTQFMRDRQAIIGLAARHRLPAIYEWPEQVDDGGLMSYGAGLGAVSQRLAVCVDRVFKGAPPGDLPIEQPPSFELVLNLTTARALGLALPPGLIARADRLVE